MNKIVSLILIHVMYFGILLASAISLAQTYSIVTILSTTNNIPLCIMIWASQFVLMFIAGMFLGREYFKSLYKILTPTHKYNRKFDFIITSMLIIAFIIMLILTNFSLIIFGILIFLIGFFLGVDYYKIENKKDCLLKVFSENE